MSKQIVIGMLAGIQAKIEAVVAKRHITYLELYRLVGDISRRDDIEVRYSEYEYEDVVEGLQNALLGCIDYRDPDYNTDWEYLSNVDWLYPDTDDDDLYERLYNENVETLFDCLKSAECITRISKAAAEFLVSHTDEVVFYNTRKGEYAWVIPFFNMPWSLVSVDVMPK